MAAAVRPLGVAAAAALLLALPAWRYYDTINNLWFGPLHELARIKSDMTPTRQTISVAMRTSPP